MAKNQFLESARMFAMLTKLTLFLLLILSHVFWSATPCLAETTVTAQTIQFVYIECLGRSASPQEVSDRLNQTYHDLVSGVCFSPEAKRYEIRKSYLNCLGREATEQEIQGWLGYQGSAPNAICASEEARIHMVGLFYNHCLHRAPTNEELLFWVGQSQFSVKELEEQICQSEEALLHVNSCYFNKTPVANHLVDSNMHYDHWQNNCHHAANNAIQTSPTTIGRVDCVPLGHAFVYKLEEPCPDQFKTTYYNWGEKCGACDGKPPANYTQTIPAEDCHSKCAQKFCGTHLDPVSSLDDTPQFSENTHPRPVGEYIEEPGPKKCANKNDNLSACNSCCQSFASGSPSDPPQRSGLTYFDARMACKNECKKKFQ